MIRPTIPALLLMTAGLAAALLPALVDGGLFPVWIATVTVVLFAVGADGLFGLGRRDVHVRVETPRTLYIGDADPMTVTIRPRLRTASVTAGISVEVLVELDDLFRPIPTESVQIAPEHETVIRLPLFPERRGTGAVRAVWLRWPGPLGLTRRQMRVAVDADVAVVPNVRAVKAAAIRHFSSRDSMVGLRAEKFLGDGTEFDSLREYMPGFDHRAIDWKASARHVKLIAREYRAERNRDIVVAVDTGRLMIEPIEGVPKLDHAINAALLFAYVGLKTGDRVGLFTFDSRVRLTQPPRGGVGAFTEFRARAAGIDYSSGETNFTLSLMTLLGQLTRRTLVVLFTDFVDTVTVELMVENLGRLADRHLVVCVTMADPSLAAIEDLPPGDLADLTRSVIAGEILTDREVVLQRLRRRGVHCIDAPVGTVSTRLVDRYLEIKRRELV
ncbi:MAG: DUF58 domain-containing protein [Planctomycetota bacterium]